MTFQIHEVYYARDGSIESWTSNPVTPLGESSGGLREDIHYFLAAFRKAVLEEREENGKLTLKPAYVDQAINEGHYFELMDRVSVALGHCHEFVGSHPLTRRTEKLNQLYEKAEAALYALYQEAANLEFDRSDG